MHRLWPMLFNVPLFFVSLELLIKKLSKLKSHHCTSLGPQERKVMDRQTKKRIESHPFIVKRFTFDSRAIS